VNYPVTLDEWRNETNTLSRDFTRDGNHYWRYVPGATYTIGGWVNDGDNDNDAQADVVLPSYWIAKYPITNKQYRQFIEAGGYTNQAYWTANGWAWIVAYDEGRGRKKPYWWDDPNYNGDNQPVVGVTWYEAIAYANWLHSILAGTLPEGYRIQLPTEAAWEVACAYDGHTWHNYPWGELPPTSDLADFGKAYSSNVGERPNGASACGVQDMVGSVWEAMSNSYDGYAAESGGRVNDFSVDNWNLPYRGGSWWDDIDLIRCSERIRLGAVVDPIYLRGIRLALIP
jgi:formylglycine-generating enzyme required for sulfatase activity